ncbi:glycosyltransferase family 4 protein [Aerophototrophica crusticola]|uniref:Glycosyltransferase family 4 protein n=1 Tax=Aerophototrophica crusticola TaxID=1709002 RepID=A0A858R9S4_9PROT|nr:glycosyltransferase family 4 protein [Rhodospirillaceae bacterium B3]
MTLPIGRPIHILSPGPISQLTGGFGYLRRLAAGLAERGEEVAVHELPGRHPFPDEEARLEADLTAARIPDGALVLVDGLALPAAAHALWMERYRLRLAALVHHPLHLEAGLDAETALVLRRLERDALALMRRVIVPSRATAADVMALEVPADRLAVVNPGTDRVAPAPHPKWAAAPGLGKAGPVILCVATLTPRKGHLVLLQALATLTDLPWTLVLAGSPDRDPAHAEAIRAAIAELGLADRVTIAGELEAVALEARWHLADLTVLPSLHEGYGMVVAEALARGLPTVATTAGALPELLPPAAGGLVPPGDAAALAAALRPLLADPTARAAAAREALEAGGALPTWDQSVDLFRAELARAATAQGAGA